MIIYLIYLPVCVIVAVYILSALRFLCAKSSTVITTPTDETCAICLLPICVGDKVYVVPCPHLFHHACLQPWLQIQRRCPVCRQGIR